MTYRQFDIEAENDLAATGLIPEPLPDGEAGATIRWESQGKIAELTYDVPGRSVRIKVYSNRQQLELDIYREGAVKLRSQSDGEKLYVRVWFQVDDLAGHIEVGLLPAIYVKDSMLFA